MLIRKFALVTLLFLRTVPRGDGRWCDAVEFWSSVVCFMENSKVVNFHGVLDGNKDPGPLERCFRAFIYDVARKCETTIMSKTYVLRDSENATPFADDNGIARGDVARPSIRDIAGSSGDAPACRATPFPAGRIRARNVKAFGGNTWNVHVILAEDVRSLERISKTGSEFEWNPQDRSIVLVARREERGRLNESYSRIDRVLRTLWSERKVYGVSVAEAILVNDTTRVVRTYNPFAKVNDSAWGEIEIINVESAEETANVLSHLTFGRTGNMNEYELKVGLFTDGQTVKNGSEENEHGAERSDIFRGFDETMLDTVSLYMNFTAKEMDPTDNQSFGYQLANGTYVGLLGDVVHGRTDMCFEAFFVKKYSSTAKEGVDFTVYFDFDRVCVVVPKARKIPKWLRIYHFFPLSVWVCSTLTHFVTYVTWYFLQTHTPGRTASIGFRATVYRSFLLNAGCPQKLPSANAERILLSGVLLANITLTGLFSGMLYNSFAHDMYYPDLNSLRDLDESGLPITLTSFSLSDLFGTDDTDATPIMHNLRQRLQFGDHSLRRAASYRNVSGFVRESYQPIFNEQYIDEEGGPLLHLIDECPGAFYLSYLLPKNSILYERINAFIGRLNQGGLPALWQSRTNAGFIVAKRAIARKKLIRRETENGFVPFNLSDMQSSFYMLLVGLLASTVVFFYERGWLKVAWVRVRKSSSLATR